jgi:hypothetical protein
MLSTDESAGPEWLTIVTQPQLACVELDARRSNVNETGISGCTGNAILGDRIVVHGTREERALVQ